MQGRRGWRLTLTLTLILKPNPDPQPCAHRLATAFHAPHEGRSAAAAAALQQPASRGHDGRHGGRRHLCRVR